MKLYAGVFGGLLEYQPHFEAGSGNPYALAVTTPILLRPESAGKKQSYVVARYAPGSLLIVSETATLYFLDEKTYAEKLKYVNASNIWTALVFRSYLVFGDDKGEMGIFNLDTLKLEWKKPMTNSVYKICTTANGLIGVSSSASNILFAQFQQNEEGAVSLEEVAKVPIPSSTYAIDFSSSERYAAACGSSTFVLLDVVGKTVVYSTPNSEMQGMKKQNTLNRIQFLNDNTVVVLSWNGEVILYNIHTKEVIEMQKGHQGVIMGLATFNQQWIVTGGYDGKVNIWYYDPEQKALPPQQLQEAEESSNEKSNLRLIYSNQYNKDYNFACIYLDTLAESLMVNRYKSKLMAIQAKLAYTDVSLHFSW